MKETEKKTTKTKKEKTIDKINNNNQISETPNINNKNYQQNYNQYGPMNYDTQPNNNSMYYNQTNYNNQMNYTPTYNIDNTYIDKEVLTQNNITNLLKFANIYKIALIVIALLIFIYFAVIEALSTAEGWIMVIVIETITIINGMIIHYFLECQSMTLHQIKEIKEELKSLTDKKRK